MSVEGKISVRPLAELLCQGESSKNIPKSELIENKAPPNVEVVTLALNKRKSRVMTTARKTKIDQGSEVPSPLKKSRTNKNQLLPGQKTIDKFFKSASKSFKIEISKEINYVIKKPQKRNKTPRNCRKKIVYSEETSVSSESKYEVPAMRKKDKKPSCTIDLVSLDSEEVPSLKTTKNLNGNKKKKRSENKNLPQKKGVSTRMRNKNSDIYNVESRNIAHSSLDTQMIETNEFNFQIIAERSRVKHPGSHPERASMLSNECIPASPENYFELSDRTKFSSAMCSTQRNPRKSMRSVRLGTSNHLGNNKPSTEIHVSSLTLQYESKKLVKAINEPTQMDTCSLVSPTPVVENALVLPPFSGSETAPRTAGVYEVQNGKENFVPVTVNTSKSKEKSEEFKFKFIESNLLASEDKTDYIIDISDDDFTQNKMQTTKITRGIYNSRKTRSNTKNTESKTKNPKKPPRPLPPYKIVEGTSFAVDAFCYGNIKGVTHYFLTHFHCDHYLGLTQKFSNIIYMSLITARLIRAFIPIDEQFIEELELNSPVIIDGVEVTAIDANHCPGAIMLIFKTSEGRCILHTGTMPVERITYKKHRQEDRQRIVESANRGDDWPLLASSFGINYKTAYSWISSGNPDFSLRGGKRPKILCEEEIDCIVLWVEEDSSITLKKLSAKVEQEFHKKVTAETISNYLNGRLISYKSVHYEPTTMNSPENKAKRRDYVRKLNEYIQAGKEIVWIDETNFNLFCKRARGRSRIGQRSVQILPPSRGKNIHLIGGISTFGVVLMESRRGSFKAADANLWVERLIQKWIELGHTADDMVLVCDNAPCHSRFESLVAACGSTLLRLAPYSPMLNPIENIWSKIKSHVKSNMQLPEAHGPGIIEQRMVFLETCIENAKRCITQSDCARVVQHSSSHFPNVLELLDVQVGT